MFNIFRRNQDKILLTIEKKLEVAKQELISNLEKNGMKFLISKMASNEVYSEHILERRKIDLSYCSEDKESWYAYQQSDKLNSQEDKTELLKLLSDKKYSDFRKYIYCCLSCICANTNDKDLFNFLIDKVQQEDDERTKVSILSRLRDVIKDSTYNIEPIKILVKEGTGDESHAAIKALANTNDPEVEDILLDEFKITSTHMKGMICGPLSTVGTLKSIPILKEAYKKTRDGYLRKVIDDAVYKIETRAKAATNNGIANKGI
ncbi:HEAT repeat domain-containing protein [Limnovirga soli]|uniref:HEAT repeat domain-containing protein n=1 Tax=Limnovirga soli TaxID=2656915 RepID=A0A8J8JV67_9BACT|nr:HEAT repeat domain-containing protein [Limnovirga soli]NNV56299.1 HEAT repeat domain-containing protein [Limnovirga soli]